MIRYELSGLKKTRRAKLPFETTTEPKRIERITDFVSAVEYFLKKPNVSGLCVKIDAQYYAWILIEDNKILNNEWVVWNSSNNILCDGLRLENKVSCLRSGKNSFTECNVIPVHDEFKIEGEFFTLQNTASPFLAYGLFPRNGTGGPLYFSYPIFTRSSVGTYLQTVRGRPLILGERQNATAAPSSVTYSVGCRDLVLEVRVSKMSDYLSLNSLCKEDQFVYAFGESNPLCTTELPPKSLQSTWFWPAFLYTGPVRLNKINYRHLSNMA